MIDITADTCQYIGPDQDPQRDWPVKMCGCKTLKDKNYCGDHFWQIYQKGSATAGKRNEKSIDAEIAELAREQEMDDIDA